MIEIEIAAAMKVEIHLSFWTFLIKKLIKSICLQKRNENNAGSLIYVKE